MQAFVSEGVRQDYTRFHGALQVKNVIFFIFFIDVVVRY